MTPDERLVEEVFSVFRAKNFSRKVIVLGSQFNHSCAANTVWTIGNENHRILFHTIRHIPAGNEVTIAYKATSQTGECD